MSLAPSRSRRRAAVLDPRRWVLMIAGALFLLLAPVLARAQGANADSVLLQWTAPGDDGDLGTATIYHMRKSTSPISSGNWNAAEVVTGLPTPMVAGTRQAVVVRGLSRDTTYYFAIRAEDDNGNLAPISNLVTWDWAFDTAPPAAPTGLMATSTPSGVQVTWTAGSEPDLLGYSVYRATASGGPYTKLTVSLLANPSYLDTSVPGGATDLWYQVTASDLSANESAPSASYHLALGGPAPTGTLVNNLEPGYPNPSHAGQPVCLPLSSGALSGLSIDIVGNGGFRIRHLDVGSAPRCPDGSVQWDGRNDAGAEVAPGVYRAWLIDGDRRESVKLVRQP